MNNNDLSLSCDGCMANTNNTCLVVGFSEDVEDPGTVKGLFNSVLVWASRQYRNYLVTWIRIRSDPNSFGSVDPDPEVKMKGKEELHKKNSFFFCRKLYFFKSDTKKVAYLKVLGTYLKIFFFLLLKDILKSN